MVIDRRTALRGAALAGIPLSSSAWAAKAEPFAPIAGPRSRVLFVNDLAGDLDGLFAAVHAVLSRSIDLRGIVATGTGNKREGSDRAVALANEMLSLMGMTGRVKVARGCAGKMTAAKTPMPSPGVQAIIEEAMRTDTRLPLYVAVGGGLTEVASALLLEPQIAGRFTLIWIGGDAYPAGGTGETNFNIDPLAAQYVFNDTSTSLWQLPRSVYATCIVSAAEIQAFVAPHGAIGRWLYQKVVDAPLQFNKALNTGETWTMGDNPLVVLAALGDWAPNIRPFRYDRTGSSLFDEVVAPRLNANGTFSERAEGRKIRIYKTIDTRLMLNDLFAKLRLNFPAQG
jgi:inosine-uridine nucleoside N-ribohydrolase